MSSIGGSCPVCRDEAAVCDRCGGRALAPLAGAANLRGHLWAERVVKLLVSRWPSFWPHSPKAVIIATRQIEDLAKEDALRVRLARICLDAAGRRYSEMIDYLFRRRLEIAPSEDYDESEIPK